MANLKISDLTVQTTLLGTDELPLNDPTDTAMAPTGTDKKITATNFLAGVKSALTTLPNTRIAFGDSSSDITSDAALTYASSTITAPNLLAKTSVKLEDTGAGVNTVSMRSPTPLAGSYTLTMPLIVGTTGQVLAAADNAGTLIFADNGGGDVVGPAGAANDAIARFDTTSGKAIKDSVALLDDSGALSGITAFNVDDLFLNGNTIASTDTNGDIILLPNGSGITTSTKSIKSEVAFILKETGVGTDVVTLQAPSSLSSSFSLTLPPTGGTAGQVLQSAGSGITQWANAAVGGPVSSTDNAIAVWDSTTGALLKNSAVILTGTTIQVGATPGTNSVSLGTGATSAGTGAVVFGLNARGVTTGIVAIGSGALSAATTGTNNVVIGLNGGSTLTTASACVLIGSGVKGNATNGSNTVVGNNGGSTSLATANTGVGQGVLATAGACSSQVAIGNNSMGSGAVSGTGSSASVAVGASTLINLSTGAANVAVGVSAGAAITTGSNCTLLGANTVSAATVDNNTVLGAAATAATFSGCSLVGATATATANNQFVVRVGSSSATELRSTLAPTVATTASIGSNSYLTVTLNGVDYKVALYT